MVYNYLKENFKDGEPIFIDEIPAKSRGYLKLELKNLVDKGLLLRYLKGVYYLPYKTILGTDGFVSFSDYINKKYFYKGKETIGYLTKTSLANMYGFTSQNSAVYSIVSNNATTKQRELNIKGRRVFIYKPYVKITKENVNELEFLELMKIINIYAEGNINEIKKRLKKYIKNKNIDFNKVKEYINYYPNIVYKNMYKCGITNELV